MEVVLVHLDPVYSLEALVVELQVEMVQMLPQVLVEELEELNLLEELEEQLQILLLQQTLILLLELTPYQFQLVPVMLLMKL